MIRNLAMISILTLTVTSTLSTVSQAQTAPPATISFNGTVAKQCTVTTTQNGTLKPDGLPLATQLITDTAGKVRARCNSLGDVQLAGKQISGYALGFDPSYSTVGTIPATGVERELTIGLSAGDNGNVIPAGSYSFKVTVTVVPR